MLHGFHAMMRYFGATSFSYLMFLGLEKTTTHIWTTCSVLVFYGDRGWVWLSVILYTRWVQLLKMSSKRRIGGNILRLFFLIMLYLYNIDWHWVWYKKMLHELEKYCTKNIARVSDSCNIFSAIFSCIIRNKTVNIIIIIYIRLFIR